MDPDSTGSRLVRRPNAATFQRVTLEQVAKELDVSVHSARRLVRRYRWLGLDPFEGRVTTYDAAGLERLKALKNIPNRAGPDWLTTYLKGKPHG